MMGGKMTEENKTWMELIKDLEKVTKETQEIVDVLHEKRVELERGKDEN